ncbi:zinc metallopeptidase [Limibacter armeniacum]|uniref:zinc metallopeptidase n=1 Tax=Limibacter armeniacum TaxID=466084 RepID=UPI002FE59847
MIWVIIIGFMILGWLVQYRLKSKFKRYSQMPIRSGLSGAEVVELMLRDNGIHDVRITCIPGKLTDHYNPTNKTINLSEAVYYGRNAAAAAVAAHETGHAVQHARAYAPLKLRSALVPIQNASTKILNIIFMFSIIGAFFIGIFPREIAFLLIIACYAVFALFSIVTLPVEFDASKRALAWIDQAGIVSSQEHEASKDALKWAAMTYVVAAISSIAMLLYYISIFMGGRD